MDTAIKVKDVSKVYKLYRKKYDRLMDSLGLSKRANFREHFALKHLDFEIKKGETVGIIGTNGAGKSTILKIITGVLSPTEGRVEIDGRISALLELGAGFNMEYTGIENIYLNGTMLGFSKEEIDNKLDSILSFAEIGDYVYQPVKTYSSGMFVRLAFAVAINIDPEILIVDEALSVGDVFFQAKCFHKFEEFKQQGKTILFVSHDLSSIQKYCDRAILLNHGEKAGEGSPVEVIDLYKRILVGQEKRSQFTANSDENNSERWVDKLSLNPNIQEYGDHIADIIDFAIIDDKNVLTDTILKGSTFTLKIKIKANEEILDPIVAFTIRDTTGLDITGTNTLVENISVGHMNANEERTLSFTQRMDLQGGQYLLCLGLTRFESDDFHVYHRLYDALSIDVVSIRDTVGVYDMNCKIEVE